MLAHFSYLIFWKIIFENLSRRMNWEIPRNRRTLFYGPISGTGDCRNSRSQNSCSGISKNRGICDRFVRDFRTKTGRGIEPMGMQEIEKIPGIQNAGINFFWEPPMRDHSGILGQQLGGARIDMYSLIFRKSGGPS